MEGRFYNISKRFEVTMTFAVFAKDESEAWDIASNADLGDVRGGNGQSFIDISVLTTDEEVVNVHESGDGLEREGVA